MRAGNNRAGSTGANFLAFKFLERDPAANDIT